jgi:MarR family transcriptional regulator, organic hydroperoxide resistance regulator
MSRPRAAPDPGIQAVLRHWREAVPNDRLAHLVRDAARGLTRALQMRLAEHDVSFGHWVFLRILWESDGLTQRELSERAGLTEPTAFSALGAMERLGYVRREQLPNSRKKVYVFLTPAGRALRETLVPLAEEVNRVAVRGASRADLAAARELLLRVIGNLAEDEAGAVQRRQGVPSTRKLARQQQNAERARLRDAGTPSTQGDKAGAPSAQRDAGAPLARRGRPP